MEKKVITKNDWQSRFYLTGKPVINDYTFKIDEESKKSSWIYNNLTLGIDCGDKFGVVFAELMGGYSSEGNSVIYVHGRKEDGTDDFDNRFEVNWEDRLDQEKLEEIGDMCFITVSLEKTKNGLFKKKFLSSYDAIAYIKKHISTDMILTVSGNLKYSEYQGRTRVKKEITNIYINENIKDSSEFGAHFTQTILIDKDSASLKNIDKDKGVMYVDAKVLDYVKEVNGVEVKGQYPFDLRLEYPLDLSNESLCKAIINSLFKVKKGYTQMTFNGDFIESGAATKVTLDDVPDEIKNLIGIVFTEEEAIEQCSSSGSKEKRMVLGKPYVKLVGEEKVPVLQKFEEKYSDDDLILDYIYGNTFSNVTDEEVPFNESVESDNDMDWLSKL